MFDACCCWDGCPCDEVVFIYLTISWYIVFQSVSHASSLKCVGVEAPSSSLCSALASCPRTSDLGFSHPYGFTLVQYYLDLEAMVRPNNVYRRLDNCKKNQSLGLIRGKNRRLTKSYEICVD